MAAVGLHRLTTDALDFHQLVVEFVDEGVVHVEHVGEAASHARTEVVTGLAGTQTKPPVMYSQQ